MKKLLTILLISVLAYFSRDAIAQNVGSGIAKALEVAVHDLSQQLETESKVKWEYSGYVSNISNYSFGISESSKFYVVVARLNKTEVKINGGGGIYYIDKSTFKVVRNVRYE